MAEAAKKSLVALNKRPDGSFQVIDATGSSTISACEINHLFNSQIITLNDCKSFLENNQIKPSPSMRIICLKTIDQICQNTTELQLLNFTNESIGNIYRNIFDIAEKFDISKLISLECQLIPAVVNMQQKGIPFLKDLWQSNLDYFEQETRALKSKLQTLLKRSAGFALFEQGIDLNNGPEVKSALEELFGFKIPSIGLSSLEDIDHEAAKMLVNLKTYERMLNTYGPSFLAKVKDGRLRGQYIPIGSSSGRLSCHEPNLLALPNHPSFQACIAPKSPYKLLRFDYGAFELRILAGLSEDKALLDIFEQGLDIHSMVAQAVFGQKVSKSENPHLREQAKIISFGLIYGMKEHSLGKQLKISPIKAQALLHRYFKKFSRVKEFLHHLEETALAQGFAKTALGRRAALDPNPSLGAHVARVSRNLPIQGTGADIIKLAMCRVYKRLHEEKLDAHMVNVVHDELVIESLDSLEDKLRTLVKSEMEQAHIAILPNIQAEVSIK